MKHKPHTAEDGYKLAIPAAGGSQRALGELLGISSQAVGQWGGKVPLDRVVAVEKATGIPRERLRPEFFAPALKRALNPNRKAIP